MNINSIFSSIQGEGIYVGFKQIFIRLAGCNLSCDYCDENDLEYNNLTDDEIIQEVQSQNKQYHHSISITGGEPLLQSMQLKELLPKLKLPIYLETNGTLPDNLDDVLGMVDIYSVDYKPGFDKEFIKFLTKVKDEDTFVKYILLPEFKALEVKELAQRIADINKDIPLIIQPVTPYHKIKHMPVPDEIMKAYNLAKSSLNEVRVIPQTHKFMKIK